MATKRILQIIATLDRGGAEQQMGLLARGLDRREFDLHVCALAGEGPLAAELRAAGIPLTAIGRRWRFDPLACWQLQQHVARLRPDLIHTWLPEANTYGYAAARACGMKRHLVGMSNVESRGDWVRATVDRYLVDRCCRVVVASGADRDCCMRRGWPVEKVQVIASGVEPAESPPTTRRQLLDELGLPEQSRLIGFAGRLVLRNRVKDAIWAADLLKVIRGDVHLLVIGDGPHRARLCKFRDQVVIRDKVHFLGDRGDVADLLPHLDVFWSTGAQGQSSAIMEALAAGVPVVATDVPDNRELIVPEETGYLVPVGSRADFARCAHRLLNDAALARRLGQAGRQRMAASFSVAQMVGQYTTLYRDLLG